MKNLMLTTAIVAVTSLGSVMTPAMAQDTQTTQATSNVPAFLASNFTGKNLYTLDTEATRELTDMRTHEDQSTWDRVSMRWESSDLFAGARSDWENVGTIDDVILTQDGEIRGVLVDVGGFLGFGARTVMIDIEQLYFVVDDENPENLDDFFVVAALSGEHLEALPEWDEDQLSLGFEFRNYESASMNADVGMDDRSDMAMQDTQAEPSGHENQTVAAARTEVPDGFEVMEAEQRTADRLLDADVYGREGEQIATVSDLVIGSTGDVTHAVMDVGGFLGMGSHTVALELDHIDILWSDEDGEVRVQLPMTEEELESLPEYEG